MLTAKANWPPMYNSMDHTSDEDTKVHSRGFLINTNNNEIGKIHVVANPADQQPARLHNRRTGAFDEASSDAHRQGYEEVVGLVLRCSDMAAFSCFDICT